MTKKDVYVVVDTPKKAKKLKNLLDMFGERTYSNSSIQDCLDNNKNVIGFEKEDNAFMSSYVDQFDNFRKKVSIKELRNILAKEHLIKVFYNLDLCPAKYQCRITPEEPVKVGDWMFNPNSKKITQVKKDNHGKSLIGSGWVKIKYTELVEKLNSL